MRTRSTPTPTPTPLTLSLTTLGLLVALPGCPTGSKGTLDADGDGWELGAGDCDDSDPSINPGAVEICEDGIDNDCDGGPDPSCITDADGDGWEASEDCDDTDSSINPDAPEVCTTPYDDNCDGIATECVDPALVYDPTNPGSNDAYAAAVFANRVIFGEPLGTAFVPGDGRVLLFELESATVDETDAVATSLGPSGAGAAHGTVLTPVGGTLCMGADYEDSGTANAAGKARCFDGATLEAATGSLALGAAAFTTAGEATYDFSTTEGEADVDGDGFVDLLVYTAHDVMVIFGDGTPWSGDYTVPTDADLILSGGCATSGTGWCGFGRATSGGASPALAIGLEGTAPDTVSLFTFPLPGGVPSPSSTMQLPRHFADSASAVDLVDGFAFGNSLEEELTFIDDSGAIVAVAIDSNTGTQFGYWSSTMQDQDGHELLLVTAPYGSSFGGVGGGVVYVFDLTAHGLPTDADQARFLLTPPPGFSSCGWRARGGIITESDGSTSTTVAVSCPGSGGAAYVLDHRPPPLPVLGPAAIVSTGTNEYEIRQWVVDAYTSQIEWIMTLAQTELVVVNGDPKGWRLHGIETGSPLYRAGLRTGDVVRKVNGVSVTTPEAVTNAFAALQDASGLSLQIQRNGQNGTLSYTFVP